jgi:hypothetical protein
LLIKSDFIVKVKARGGSRMPQKQQQLMRGGLHLAGQVHGIVTMLAAEEHLAKLATLRQR